MRHPGILAAIALLSAFAVSPASLAQTQAQAGSDSLGQCLIQATTPADRKVLARWAFATMALDPDVTSLATIDPAQREAINQHAGSVVTALLADACRTPAQQALATGGPSAVEAAFEAWGRWAVTGLVSEPHVAQGMGALLQYIDIGKLMSLLPLQGLPPAAGGTP